MYVATYVCKQKKIANTKNKCTRDQPYGPLKVRINLIYKLWSYCLFKNMYT